MKTRTIPSTNYPIGTTTIETMPAHAAATALVRIARDRAVE